MRKTHLLVQVLQPLILRREAALGSDIHDHEDFALERAEVELFPAEVLDNEIKQRLGHFLRRFCFKGEKDRVSSEICHSDIQIKNALLATAKANQSMH